MKLDFNRKYTTIAVYAFLVIAAGLLFQNIVNDIPPLTRYINQVSDLLRAMEKDSGVFAVFGLWFFDGRLRVWR